MDQASQSRRTEPIAIVGVGCRFPGGVRSADDLWDLVVNEREALTEFPENRGWDTESLYHPDPGNHGTSYLKVGGFVHDVDLFDAGFFGIGPREATAMDPQQRLLLEITWEALENAAIDPHSLRGTPGAVFVGIAHQDYGPRWHQAPQEVAGQVLTGTVIAVASGRIAHTLGIEGPAVTLDTACSSSLTTIHLACQSLRAGECSVALAGGATVLATPGAFIEFSPKRALSSDGRCKPFSSDADGLVWAEGAGMLVLERLDDARRNGHPVLALVRGTAVNHDGVASGLTTPSEAAQVRVIRRVLDNAGLEPQDVDAVETHGTGTKLGDPIEARALLQAYGQDRDPNRPLWIGSVKSNIGHTAAAAGVAGVIKMIAAMDHGVLPCSLHVREPNKRVDWTGGVEVLAGARPWPELDRPRRTGVSAFGIGGTNAHVVLEQAPAEAPAPIADITVSDLMFALSARSEVALRAQAANLHEYLRARPETVLADVSRTLAGRSQFEHRSVLLADDRDEFMSGLRALAAGKAHPAVSKGMVKSFSRTRSALNKRFTHDVERRTGPGLAMLFTGQGSQRAGMGRELYSANPVFRKAFDEVTAIFDELLPFPLRPIIFADEGSLEEQKLHRADFAQPALFSLGIALYRAILDWGLVPDVLFGHSFGELIAARAAGVWSLQDACALVVERGRLMHSARSDGTMISIQASEQEILPSLERWADNVSLAVVNGPASVVVSGDRDAAARIAEIWRMHGRKTTRLKVACAAHSPHMDELMEPLRTKLESLTFRPPEIPIVSSVTGDIVAAEQLCSPDYWVRQLRQAVRFHDAVRYMNDLGISEYLELGADPVLTSAAKESLADRDHNEPRLVATLRAGQSERDTVRRVIAELQVHGAPVDLDAATRDVGARTIALPTYPFQGQRFWLTQSGLSADDRSPMATESWRYEEIWRPISLVDARLARAELSGRWLIAVTGRLAGSELADTVMRSMTAAGVEVCLLPIDDSAADRASVAVALRELDVNERPQGIVSLLAVDDLPDERRKAVDGGLTATLALAQAASDVGLRVPIWCVTRGAVQVDDFDEPPAPVRSMLWGLVRTGALEEPELWGGLVDLPRHPNESTFQQLCDLLRDRRGEFDIALRADGTYARRIVKVTRQQPTRVWRPRGTVLVTGGSGALGGYAARWLARHGAEHVVLASRSGKSAPGIAELEAALETLGVRVTIATCDVSKRADVAALLAGLDEAPRAVVHTAGVPGTPTRLLDLEPAEIGRVAAGKVLGAMNLDSLLDNDSLEVFLLFSSMSAVVGAKGLAAYSAANAYLDGLARERRARGNAATAIAFGMWGDGGMAADTSSETSLSRGGMIAMAPRMVTAAMWDIVSGGATARILADVDWPRFSSTLQLQRATKLFDEVTERPVLVASPSESDRGRGPALAELDDDDRYRALLEQIRGKAATVLGYSSASEVDSKANFAELGFDSLAFVDLSTSLGRSTGLKLPAKVVYDHPTAAELATHLNSQFRQGSAMARPTADSERGTISRPGGGIRDLYRNACAQEMLPQGFALLAAAAALRETFDAANVRSRANPAEPVLLTEGASRLGLVCVPPVVAPSGAQNYLPLARHLDGRSDVYVLPHPGFGDTGPVPSTVDALFEYHLETLIRHFADRPIVLAGYSSGGWVSHGLATHAETHGIDVRSVVLLDSPRAGTELAHAFGAFLPLMAADDHLFQQMTDEQLTAMSAYGELALHWKPEPVRAPVLLARATDRVAELPAFASEFTDDGWRAMWDVEELAPVIRIPGDHLSIMNENAAETAKFLVETIARADSSVAT
ncbi:type I polyketide synthase [Saccharomonospora sp. NPDC046836]|uniref:type I polyketide synthase n=1 Tax=Saccharomonospora sp. NPDC046836 TaxID=3156921 RepID=UPI0033C98AE9